MRKILTIATLVGCVALIGTVWYKLHRQAPQPEWITVNDRDNFLYGSPQANDSVGIPYWIWLALPRMFPEYLPGPGGYASLGSLWEEGREMPVGFSKELVGYVRVEGNCALCHAASYRKEKSDTPLVVGRRSGRNITANRLFWFFKQCAKDPRFNAGDILAEVAMATKLSLLDRLLYRFILIPRTRQAILDGLPIFVNAELLAHSRNAQVGSPELGGLQKVRAATWFAQQKPAAYPFAIDRALASAGQPIFAGQCAACHANALKGPFLEGLWLRAPYLDNHSIPTIRDLLLPVGQRPNTFYQGNDLLDTARLGFVSTEPNDMGRQFPLFETTKPGNSNTGHLYGTSLSGPDQNALLEYLKIL